MEQSYNPTPGSFNTGTPPSGPPPKNWLVESILVTIFCCLPFGIVAIVKAAKVNKRYAEGDYAGALEASKSAGKWTKIGLFSGLAFMVLYFAFILFFGGAEMLSALQRGAQGAR